jgi:myo-inositol-1(or 4)-monophosphatase
LAHTELTIIAIEAAVAAGELLRKGFGTIYQVGSKAGHHNLVTEYDLRAEKLILDFIRKKKPESEFLAEESGQTGKGDLLWIVDPLDGTVNFAHNIPFFSVSIGVESHGKMVSGVVFHPLTEELFVAELGRGATLNGKKIEVSKNATLDKSILATGFPYTVKENPEHCIDHFVDILGLGIPIRRLGSAAIDLCYTAAGRFDGYFEVALTPWDLAAGKLILEEAGGKITSWDGSPLDIRTPKTILGTNGLVHKEALQLFSRPK